MRENLNTAVFAVGLCLSCGGLWAWFSWPSAAVFAGLTMMGAALYPYVTIRNRG